MTSHGLTIHNCRDDDDDNGNNLILQCLEHSKCTYYDYVANLSPRSIKLHHDFHYISFSLSFFAREQAVSNHDSTDLCWSIFSNRDDFRGLEIRSAATHFFLPS